jgi:hypothetical protein
MMPSLPPARKVPRWWPVFVTILFIPVYVIIALVALKLAGGLLFAIGDVFHGMGWLLFELGVFIQLLLERLSGLIFG